MYFIGAAPSRATAYQLTSSWQEAHSQVLPVYKYNAGPLQGQLAPLIDWPLAAQRLHHYQYH